MLTLETLFAVLQGLPSSFLTGLDPSWQAFCCRLEFAVHYYQDPREALKQVLREATPREIRLLIKALSKAESVMCLPDLSARQKQALIVLRYENCLTLSRLYKLLNWDRSNTYRCLLVLMKKGYVGKFQGDMGPAYFAINRALDGAFKASAFGFIHDYLRQLLAESPFIPPTPEGMTTMTTRTTLTTPTTRQPLAAGPAIFDLRSQPAPSIQPALADTG